MSRKFLLTPFALALLAGCGNAAAPTPGQPGPAATNNPPAAPSGAGSAALPPITTAGSPATNMTNTAAGSGNAQQPPAQQLPSKPLGSSAGAMATTPVMPTPGMMLDPKLPFSQVPANCRGFEVVGLKNSPGGDVLPNTCAPFDGTYNNPYAIRCLEADPKFSSGYAGDEFCILPPPADKGTQVHAGPMSYTDTAEVQPYLLKAGGEINTYYYINAPNPEAHYYYRTNWRMRPGSHHMIISLMADRGDGWAGTTEAGTDIGLGGKSFGGAQRPDVDRPQGTLAVPPENDGLGAQLEAKQQFSFNFHHINTGDKPILREAWVNVWYKDEKDVSAPMQGLSIFGNPADVAVPPGERRTLHYKCDVKNDTRIVALIGHRHANTDRFGIWIERGGEKIEAYESFDYTDMPSYQYDSISTNPKPDVANKVDGAYSGKLELKLGDQFHFVCDIENRTQTRLKFANELITGEMCIVFGSYTGNAVCAQATRVMD